MDMNLAVICSGNIVVCLMSQNSFCEKPSAPKRLAEATGWQKIFERSYSVISCAAYKWSNGNLYISCVMKSCGGQLESRVILILC